jgi:hypothetical protein
MSIIIPIFTFTFFTLYLICINIVKLEWRASLFLKVAIVPPIFFFFKKINPIILIKCLIKHQIKPYIYIYKT